MFGRTIARLFTLFIVLLLFPVQVAAQQQALITDQTVPPPPKENPPLLGMDIRFDRYSNDQGLSMSVVNAIAQDRQGFLWFATQDGLNRYDGYKFRIFKHDPEKPDSLGANWIQSLLVDSSGNLWIGTFGGGLNRYDSQTGQFIRFLPMPDQENGLSGNNVSSIYEDRSGMLWIVTENGLDRYDPKTEGFSHWSTASNTPQDLQDLMINTVYQDRSGFYWFASQDGLVRYNLNTQEFELFQHDEKDSSSLNYNYVTMVLEDKKGNLWVATRGGGLDLLNQAGTGFIHHELGEKITTSSGAHIINTLYEDTYGRLWIGTSGGGLLYFDPTQGDVVEFRNELENPFSLSSDNVISIFSDLSGSVWIGTFGGGLSKFDRLSQQFLHYRSNPRNENSLSNNAVWAIHASEDTLWIGTDGGLDRIDRKTGKFEHYRHDPLNDSSLISNMILAVYQDQSGSIWVGGKSSGLNRFDPSTNGFIKYLSNPDDKQSISDNTVFFILQDLAGFLWIGTSKGLNRFDVDNEVFMPFISDPEDPSSLSSNKVFTGYRSRDGKLWLGTDAGLDIIDPTTYQIQKVEFVTDKETKRIDSRILSVLEDQSGIMWFGTVGEGMIRYDPSSREARWFREKDGLSNDTVYGILEANGQLWISTNNGLSRFDLSTESFKKYTARDGLQGNEFNSGAFFKSDQGELFFGGINGLTAFYPQFIRENDFVPPIALVSFSSIGNQLEGDLPPETLQEITLKWPANTFDFEFTALSYVQADRNQYAYYLENFDRDWTQNGANHFGRYTNLPGGEYRLHIRGSNNAGIWNETGTTINIQVIPPFWQTALFQASLVLLVGLLVFTGYRWRVRNVVAHNQKLEALVEDRTHEIEQRRQELEALYSADEALYRNLHLDQVLQALVDSAINLLHADKGSLLVWDEGKNRLVPKASRGFDPNTVRKMNLRPGEGIAGIVALTGEPVLVPDVTKEPRVSQKIIEPEGIRSFLQVPIKVGGEVFGVFSTDYTQPNAFNEDQLRLLSSLAQRAGLAIQNAQIYEHTQEQAIVEERSRLARELHDAVTQTLFSASLLAEALPAAWANDPQEARQLLEELRQLNRSALAEMRALLMELRPSALAEANLEDLLRQLGEAASGREGIPVKIVTDGHCPLPPDVHIALYRIAQEALNNALKHSRADSISIRLKCLNSATDNHDEFKSGIILTVQDNGRGFQLDQIPSNHLGLNIMRERAQSIGANLSIESQPNQGTQVYVAWGGNHYN